MSGSSPTSIRRRHGSRTRRRATSPGSGASSRGSLSRRPSASAIRLPRSSRRPRTRAPTSSPWPPITGAASRARSRGAWPSAWHARPPSRSSSSPMASPRLPEMAATDRPLARSRATPPGAVWTGQTVAWYERANEQSDYARRVLDVIAPLVAECRSALDVGAGFGALALPLARRLQQVTALEPSPPMAAALRRAAARAGFGNVTVIEAAWGEVELKPHDLVVCAHVGPLLQPDSPFLAEIGRVAERGVALVRDTPGGDDKFFFSELYPFLLGRPYGRCDGAAETLEA